MISSWFSSLEFMSSNSEKKSSSMFLISCWLVFHVISSILSCLSCSLETPCSPVSWEMILSVFSPSSQEILAPVSTVSMGVGILIKEKSTSQSSHYK